MLDPKNELTLAVLQPSTAKTGNWNSATVLDVSQYEGNVAVILNAGAKTAGDNADSTHNIRLMDSAESNGANATNLNIAFAEVNASTGNSFQTVSVDTRACKKYIKAVAVIAGTNSPSFPVGLSVVGRKQVQ